MNVYAPVVPTAELGWLFRTDSADGIPKVYAIDWAERQMFHMLNLALPGGVRPKKIQHVKLPLGEHSPA